MLVLEGDDLLDDPAYNPDIAVGLLVNFLLIPLLSLSV